jgi:hypothetical protein
MASVFASGAEAQTNASQRRRANRQRRVQAAIQETYSHKFEVELGGGYLRFRPGPQLPHNNEIGWHVAGARYFNQRLGVAADFRGYYGTAFTYPNTFAVFKPAIREYVYQAGPTYRFYAQQRFAFSGHVLAGASTGVFDVGTNHIPPAFVGIYPVGTVFATTVGLTADFNIDPTLAIRVSPELLITTFGGDSQLNKGVTFGVIYRFGQQ